MTDVLDRLREANPVDAEALDLPPAPSTPARARRRWQLVTVAAAVGVAALALVLARGGSSDLAARAYAATNGGIVHWRTEIVNRSNGRLFSRERVEGWATQWTTHVLHYDLVHGKARLTAETRLANGRARTWDAGSNDYSSYSASTPSGGIPSPMIDPFAAFRRAYREKRLAKVADNHYRMTFGREEPKVSLDYELDPKTARPRRLTITSPNPTAGRTNVTTVDFALRDARGHAGHAGQARASAPPGRGPVDDARGGALRSVARRRPARRRRRAQARPDGPQPGPLQRRCRRHPRPRSGDLAHARSRLRVHGGRERAGNRRHLQHGRHRGAARAVHRVPRGRGADRRCGRRHRGARARAGPLAQLPRERRARAAAVAGLRARARPLARSALRHRLAAGANSGNEGGRSCRRLLPLLSSSGRGEIGRAHV